MQRSPLATLAALGIVGVLVLVLMYLFAMGQVSDTTAAQTAHEIDESLGRSMEPGTRTRVTMTLDGTGVDAPRRYIVRYAPAPAIAADAEVSDRLAVRIARLVVARLDHVPGPVRIHCDADLGGGRRRSWWYLRTGGSGSWGVEPTEPPADVGVAPPTPRKP